MSICMLATRDRLKTYLFFSFKVIVVGAQLVTLHYLLLVSALMQNKYFEGTLFRFEFVFLPFTVFFILCHSWDWWLVVFCRLSSCQCHATWTTMYILAGWYYVWSHLLQLKWLKIFRNVIEGNRHISRCMNALCFSEIIKPLFWQCLIFRNWDVTAFLSLFLWPLFIDALYMCKINQWWQKQTVSNLVTWNLVPSCLLLCLPKFDYIDVLAVNYVPTSIEFWITLGHVRRPLWRIVFKAYCYSCRCQDLNFLQYSRSFIWVTFLVLQLKPISFTELFRMSTRNAPSAEVLGNTWTNLGKKLILGELIYPWIEPSPKSHSNW